jgi:outer membrane protein OmpA-like peptidoglycan-associated protein
MSSYDVSITRIGEDELMVVIDEKLVFGKDQFTFIEETQNKVDRVITVMSKYPYFHVNIGMHAIDSNWSEPNQGLFSLRMESLNDYFKNKDIGVGRLSYHLNREQYDICSSKSLIEVCQLAKVKIYITPLLSSIY